MRGVTFRSNRGKRSADDLRKEPKCKRVSKIASKELNPNALDESYKSSVKTLDRNLPEQRDLSKTTLFVPFHFSGGSGGAIGPSTPFLSKSGGLCVANDGGLAIKSHPPLISNDDGLGFDCSPPLKSERGKLSIATDGSLTLREDGKLSTSDYLSDHRTSLNVLTSGEFGCKYFRIPFVFQRANGDLIAGGDARFDRADDFGKSGIAVCVSYDGGLTFPKKTVILPKDLEKSRARYLDPCLAENSKGKLFLFTVYFEGNQHLESFDQKWDFVYYTSYDALQWNGPFSLKDVYKPQPSDNGLNYFFQSPNNGILLTDGTMVIPAQLWQFPAVSGRYPNFRSGILYSKDDGKTWRVGRYLMEQGTNECAVIEYPDDNTVMCIAKKARVNDTAVDRTRSIFYTEDLAETDWRRHRTDDTIRMRNMVQCSAISFIRGQIFGAPRPDMRVAILCSPLVNDPSSEGRGYITLQYMTEETLDWIPSSVITPVPTLGYTRMALDSKRGRLYVVIETSLDVRTDIWLVNCSDAWTMIKTPMMANVNQGFEVTVNSDIDESKSDVRFRYEGTQIWVGGTLTPKTGRKFPSREGQLLFEFDINYGISPRKGFITAFGWKELFAKPYLLYYERQSEHGERILVKTFTIISDEWALSDCTKLFIPDCRVITFC